MATTGAGSYTPVDHIAALLAATGTSLQECPSRIKEAAWTPTLMLFLEQHKEIIEAMLRKRNRASQ
jgi:hypothetical protein